MNKQFAGGGIMDVGCYAVSMVRLLAGANVNKPYLEPNSLQAVGYIDPETGVDTWASALLTFENAVTANLNCATQGKADNRLVIFGTKGRIEVSNPWKPTQQETIQVFYQEDQVNLVAITAHTDMMGLEFEQLHTCIRNKEKDVSFPAMTRQESLANMHVLDRWRQAIGLVFEQDTIPQAR
jgi:predicted dehydrogenase